MLCGFAAGIQVPSIPTGHRCLSKIVAAHDSEVAWLVSTTRSYTTPSWTTIAWESA